MRSSKTTATSAAEKLGGFKLPSKQQVREGAEKLRGVMGKGSYLLGVVIALLDDGPSAVAGLAEQASEAAEAVTVEDEEEVEVPPVRVPRPPSVRSKVQQ